MDPRPEFLALLERLPPKVLAKLLWHVADRHEEWLANERGNGTYMASEVEQGIQETIKCLYQT